jgi:hypothetical protein
VAPESPRAAGDTPHAPATSSSSSNDSPRATQRRVGEALSCVRRALAWAQIQQHRVHALHPVAACCWCACACRVVRGCQ